MTLVQVCELLLNFFTNRPEDCGYVILLNSKGAFQSTSLKVYVEQSANASCYLKDLAR